MKVTFRVDASSQIGTGHLVRCLTLAKSLRRNGAEIRFICRNIPSQLAERARSAEHDLIILSKSQSEDLVPYGDQFAYASWLGVRQQTDADQTLNALGGYNDWLVVDHYGIDDEWEKRLRNAVRKILVIDDLANRRHDCDIFLDQNLISNSDDRYGHLLSANCRKLLGPSYALLQDDFVLRRHNLCVDRSRPVRRVLIFFGGGDDHHMTEIALRGIIPLISDVEIVVVVGMSNPNSINVQNITRGHRSITVHYGDADMPSLIAESDLAFGASGTSIWERCCLGLPSAVVILADNQAEVAQSVADAGVAQLLGSYKNINESVFATTYQGLTQNAKPRVNMSARGRQLVDGEGTRRVTEAMQCT